ncbi:MAG: proton-conducting transporter membrane subunit, partial [Planctomycetota bacterium]
LVTHAFFKALLFLGAGSVIHGMHGEQDMHKMGNLREHMPWTYRTFVVGAAALSGLPLLAGFWSKDEILALNFAKGGAWYALWAVGIVTAAITAYYSWRMVALTFHGEERFDAKEVHPHEGGAVMNVPLILLAVLAALGGAIGLPHVLHVPHLLHEWLHPVTEVGEAVLVQTTGHGSAHLSVTTEWILLGLGSLIALVFSFLGFRHHASGIAKDEAIAAKNPALAGLFANAWGLDSAFNRGVVGPVKAIAMAVSVAIDSFAIDGLVNGAANSAKDIGSKLRAMADGRVSHYALWMGGGAATIAFLWIWSA